MKNLFVILLLIASAIAQAATTEGGSQGVTIRPAGTSAGATGELRLKELTANGANHVGLKAPDAISADKVWTLPAADGTNGQVLTTNGSGVLSFTTATGSVTDVTASSPLASSGGATPNISISSIIGSSFGGTGNGFTKFSGPATSEKTFTLPNSNGVILAPSSIGTNAQIPISDGTSVTMRSISSDATITNAGALTIANNAITTAKIADANVTTAKIADSNVTTAKIADANITLAKLERSARPVQNLVINGEFAIQERGLPDTVWGIGTGGINGTSARLLNEFGPDCWYVLTNQVISATGLKVRRESASSEGATYSMECTPTVSADRYGFIQVIGREQSIPLRGRTARFQARVKRDSGSGNWRCAIINWTGAADTVGNGKQVVNSWTSGTYTEGNFFASNADYDIAAVSSAVSVGTSYTDVSTTATISSSVNNIMVFIWQDHAESSVLSNITKVGLYDGAEAREWFPRTQGEELRLCRYLCWVIKKTTATAFDNRVAGAVRIASGVAGSLEIMPPVPLRIVPSSITATANEWTVTDSANAAELNSISINASPVSTTECISLQLGNGTGVWSSGRSGVMGGSTNNANGRIIISADY